MQRAWLFVLLVGACNSPTKGIPTAEGAKPNAPTSNSSGRAVVGQPAPDFELVDLEGRKVGLSDHRGKIVVLEWFNPECPYVKASHTKGSLVGTAERHTKGGVVWLAINSGAPGKQGHGREKNVEAGKSFGLSHPILLDESGQVGRAYGARTTPHMYVIDAQGVLVYAGAIDNSPDGERESPSGGKLVSYVDDAVAALAAGKNVPVATSEPYGCSVKYAK